MSILKTWLKLLESGKYKICQQGVHRSGDTYSPNGVLCKYWNMKFVNEYVEEDDGSVWDYMIPDYKRHLFNIANKIIFKGKTYDNLHAIGNGIYSVDEIKEILKEAIKCNP
jgi:hypothetical protein